MMKVILTFSLMLLVLAACEPVRPEKGPEKVAERVAEDLTSQLLKCVELLKQRPPENRVDIVDFGWIDRVTGESCSNGTISRSEENIRSGSRQNGCTFMGAARGLSTVKVGECFDFYGTDMTFLVPLGACMVQEGSSRYRVKSCQEADRGSCVTDLGRGSKVIYRGLCP